MEKFRAQHEQTEDSSVLDEEGTLQFMVEHGVKPLEDWKEGQPVLYVFPDRLREEKKALATTHGVDVPANERPTIARIAAPEEIKFHDPREDPVTAQVVYDLNNYGSQIDYFVIDAETRTPRLIRTTDEKTFTYFVRKETLFAAADDIFPPSKHEK